jgi:hypothetical protein
MSRQILAVVVGFILWSAVWLGYNAILHAMNILPQDQTQPVHETGVLLALLIGGVLATLTAGYVATLAVDKVSKPPITALGLLLLSTGIFVQVQLWDLMPLWYHVSFLALLLPVCKFGASLGRPRQPISDDVTQ